MALHWNKKFQPGLAYVMLSRTQTLDDIYIVESKSQFATEAIKVNTDALEENERIRASFLDSQMKKELMYANCLTMSYLNVRRLLPHLPDVSTDNVLMKSDIVALGETWLKPSENIELAGYQSVHVKSEEGGKGLSVFVKSGIKFNHQEYHGDRFSLILLQLVNIDIAFVYLSKGFNWIVFKEVLEQFIHTNKNIAVIGDTNIDILSENHNLIDYLLEKSFVQLVQQPTHERGGLLDHIYINVSLQKKYPFCAQTAVYYSDHDIVSLHVPEEYFE